MAKRKPIVVAESELVALGISFAKLELEETARLMQRWRETFARPLKRARGVWKYAGFDWHVFSWKFTYALDLEEARAAYARERGGALFVLPNDSHLLGCKIECDKPPPLDGAHDIYVTPGDFRWTMAFTHEDGWLGPYFSRAEWVEHPPVAAAEPSERSKNKKKRSRRGSRK